ncbi:MAG: M1 family metallopeptidase [Pseudohongiellaceae bacterium]
MSAMFTSITSVVFSMQRNYHYLWLAFFIFLQACSTTGNSSLRKNENLNYPDRGVSWNLAQFRSQSIQGLRYHFELTVPSVHTDPIQGRAKLTFNLDEASGLPVVLDFLSPQERVSSLKVNGIETQWTASHDHIVMPALAFGRDQNILELDFQVGDEAFNRNPDFLYALFVPDRAHYSLPLFDQPNLKAPVTWEVTAPKDWQVVANGPAVDSFRLGDSTRTIFAETKPMPSYLFAIAAGKFEVETATLNGREFNMFHRETDDEKVSRNKDEIFKLHADTLAWLEDYTQIEYPFQKFDFVLTPSFQYGGMEHPGGILYRQASLLLEETATQRQALSRASLIAHETAHMWFGDLVTMNWFDDVWTKEVFANFMAAKIINPAFPEIDHELRFLTAHHPAAYSVDRTDGANEIRQTLDNLRFAGTLYGSIIYQKAPIVMRHLENRVGEENFRDGMREYLARFSYANATWPDLIEILDTKTPENLAAWSEVWVSEAGRPVITVSRRQNEILIDQADPNGLGRIWPQSLTVLVGNSQDFEAIPIELGDDTQVITGLPTSEFVLPNGSGLEYGNFVLDAPSQEYLLNHANEFPEALVRGAIWVTLWEQVLENRLQPSTFFKELIAAIPTEQDELILAQLLSYLSSYWKYSSHQERSAMTPAIESMLWSEINSNRPRSARSLFYGRYRQLASSESALTRLERLWRGEEAVKDLPLSEAEQIAAAFELTLKGHGNSGQILDEQRAKIKNPDRLSRFDFVRPALSDDIETRDMFIESLASVENRNREAWVLSALNYVHHPVRANQSIRYIDFALSLLSEIQATGDIFFPGRWLDANLSGHNSAEAAEVVNEFLKNSPTLSPRLRLKVLQSADGLFRSARIVNGWQP